MGIHACSLLKDPIDTESALSRVMIWRRKVGKPLPDPIMIQVTWRMYASSGHDELSLLSPVSQ